MFQQLPPEEPRHLFAAGKAAAYYMEPPEVAVRPFVMGLTWSADGGTLLVRRLVPPAGTPPLALAAARQTDRLEGMMRLHPRVQLVAWSRSSRTSRTLLDFDSDRANVEEVEAMKGADRALVLISERAPMPDGTLSAPRESYVLVAGATGAVSRLWTAAEPGEATTHIELSPKRPLGAIVRRGAAKAGSTVAFFGPDGKVGAPVRLAAGRSFGYAADGGPGVGSIALSAKGKKTYVFRRLDPRTGAEGAEADFNDPSEEREPPMRVLRDWERGKDEPGVILEIAGGDKGDRGTVATDGVMPALSPRNDAVAYVWGNAAVVRPLVKVDRKAYELAMQEAEKGKAIRVAKQMGVAMAMYAADSDDAFPLGGDKQSVEPYIKNRDMLAAFTYTYGGGPITGDPSTTEIGFVGGPGGRAVVYADGRVVWVPD